ncbi:MAG: hypothetical protein ACJAZO_001711 [Myxococcota bacterium]|jgi:hypothetical protein
MMVGGTRIDRWARETIRTDPTLQRPSTHTRSATIVMKEEARGRSRHTNGRRHAHKTAR